MTRLARKLEIDEARDAVIEAARTWYAGRGNVEAPLATAITRLSELERSLQKRLEGAMLAPDWMPERLTIDGSPPACILPSGLTLRETAETPGAVEALLDELAKD